MKEVLDDLEHGKYKRMMVKVEGEAAAAPGAVKQANYKDNSLANKGQIVQSDDIKF
jgi:hypothetical protein